MPTGLWEQLGPKYTFLLQAFFLTWVMPLALQFMKAVEMKQVAEQDAERAKFVVMKAEQVRWLVVLQHMWVVCICTYTEGWMQFMAWSSASFEAGGVCTAATRSAGWLWRSAYDVPRLHLSFFSFWSGCGIG